jgi:hypothetical protein
MTRNRTSAKKAGNAFETLVANYLAARLDDRIERRAKTGAKDRGDVGGVRHMGQRLVIECKDYGGRLLPGEWLAEAETERMNDGALAGLVVAKRRGETDPAAQYVLLSLGDFAALLVGQRAGEQPRSTRREDCAICGRPEARCRELASRTRDPHAFTVARRQAIA